MISGDPARTLRKSIIGCGCGVLVIGGFVAGIVYVSCSNFMGNMMGEKTYAISGDNRHFDPFAKLPEIRSRVGKDARLTEIRANFVRPDGTMDLEAKYTPFPTANYTFQRPLDKPPENAPPIGAGRGPDDQWFVEVRVSCYQPGQRRQVSRTGGGVSTRYQYTHLGMDVDEGTPQSGKLEAGLPDPKCSTQKLWETAIARNARGDAVARIEYGKGGYIFSIDGTGIRFQCDENCVIRER